MTRGISTRVTLIMLSDFIAKRQPISGVARAFPGGRLAHPEGQNEEENEKKIEEK